MMNGGDLYELAKILGHANIKMTERYAKLGKSTYREDGCNGSGNVEIDGRRRSGSNSREPGECSLIVPLTETHVSGYF
jgi:hypothetical protein